MDYRAQPGPEYYKSHKDNQLEDSHTIQRKKFGDKALIWQTICACGQRSRTFIITNESLDASVHLKNCFKMGLLPFIS